MTRAPIRDRSRPAPGRRLRLGERERFMLALIAPSALVLLCFQVAPILIGANASFREWALYDPKKTWVGLLHYGQVLGDGTFLGLVLPNTFLFLGLAVVLELAAGLALALLMNRPFRARPLMQTVVLLPLMVAPVIAAIMMRWLFNDQFGIVNTALGWIGIAGPPWLARRWLAFAVILATDLWQWTPWFALLFLAGLQSLPREPFEAAAIDAASRWRVFRYLTLPMLRPVMVACIVIRAIDAFRTFDIVWTISGGGPARQTEMFSVYTFVSAFQDLDFGRGSAASIVGALLIMGFAFALYRLLNRWVEVSK